MNVAPVVLEGDTVRLEPLSLAHLDDLCRVGFDPLLWRFSISQVRDRAAMLRYVETALCEHSEGTALPFAVFLRATGELIGSTRFANIVVPHRRVEIGWTWLARSAQRTRANTEQKFLMLRHAFDEWKVNRVELKTSALNQPSRSAILRIGATEEGTFRRHMINEDGSLRDTVYYSIIDLEWPSVRARLATLLARPGRD